jgi:hypothetical protein
MTTYFLPKNGFKILIANRASGVFQMPIKIYYCKNIVPVRPGIVV